MKNMYTHFTSKRLIVLVFGAFLLFSGYAEAQLMVTLNPIKDNSIYEDPDTNANATGDGIYVGGSNTMGARRGLINFDLSSVPAGSIVDSVFLEMKVTKVPSGGVTGNVGLHLASVSWKEGISTGTGAGGHATAGEVSWNCAEYNGSGGCFTAWATPGGDFDTLASGTASVSGLGTYTWGSTPEMVADVQYWVDTMASNFGWFLVMDNEDVAKTAKKFGSREATLTNQPVLTVYYSAPTSNDLALEAEQYTLYPNPTTGIINITFESTPSSISVFDMLGRAYTANYSYQSLNEIKMDLSDYETGIYFVKIESEGKETIRKIVITE